MMIFISINIFIYLKTILKLKKNKKVFKNEETIIFNKRNFGNWMKLTKKERYFLTKQESDSYLNKRRLLLEEIRKEYKKISKRNSKKN